MANVNQVIVLEDDVPAGASRSKVETFSPAAGERTATVGLATNSSTDITYYLTLNETILVDGIDGSDAADLSDPFRFEITMEAGDTLTLEADNADGSNAVEATVYLLAENSQLPGT